MIASHERVSARFRQPRCSVVNEAESSRRCRPSFVCERPCRISPTATTQIMGSLLSTILLFLGNLFNIDCGGGPAPLTQPTPQPVSPLTLQPMPMPSSAPISAPSSAASPTPEPQVDCFTDVAVKCRSSNGQDWSTIGPRDTNCTETIFCDVEIRNAVSVQMLVNVVEFSFNGIVGLVFTPSGLSPTSSSPCPRVDAFQIRAAIIPVA